jgi:glucokinase
MLLAADVGGTKTLIGLYRPHGPRPTPVATRVYATLDYNELAQIVRAFLDDIGSPTIEAVVAGVAGPVTGLFAELTNAPWTADMAQIARDLGGCPAALLNDLESMAYSVWVLDPDEQLTLQAGQPNPGGNRALIAAGTGLNASHIQHIDGRLVPSASESGHADFAARSERELAFVAMMTREHGRAEVESVLSGPGIVNLYRFTHQGGDVTTCPVPPPSAEDRDIAADVTKSALGHRCDRCVEALQMFVEAYGAEAGNLALRSMATGGVYVGGGIAPKIVAALQTGGFMHAFRSKGSMTDLLTRVPVNVILNSGAGLVGASVKAATLIR